MANTVAKWVHPEFVNPDVIFAGLLGAIEFRTAPLAAYREGAAVRRARSDDLTEPVSSRAR